MERTAPYGFLILQHVLWHAHERVEVAGCVVKIFGFNYGRPWLHLDSGTLPLLSGLLWLFSGNSLIALAVSWQGLTPDRSSAHRRADLSEALRQLSRRERAGGAAGHDWWRHDAGSFGGAVDF